LTHHRAKLGLLLALGALVFGTVGTQASIGGGGQSTDATCAPVTRLTIGSPTEDDASGQLTVYCRMSGTNSRNGKYEAGSTSAPAPAGPCRISVSGETAQVFNTPSVAYTSGNGPQSFLVYPIAFWSGTTGATFTLTQSLTIQGTPSDAVDEGGANWASYPGYGPSPPSDTLGTGMATALLITSGLTNQVVTVSIVTTSPGRWEKDRNGGYICSKPQLSVSFQTLTDSSLPPGNPTPPTNVNWSETKDQTAVAKALSDVSQIQSDINAQTGNFVDQAPACFWLPTPFEATVPEIEYLMSLPDAEGNSIVYSFYLQVVARGAVQPDGSFDYAASDIDWHFGDGTSITSPVIGSGPGSCVSHTYTEVDGTAPPVTNTCTQPDATSGVPPDGATIVACEDLNVVAFVGWEDQNNNPHFQCVEPGTGLGAVQPSQAAAMHNCQIPIPIPLADTPFQRPVYQIRPIPVA
jgi:hypothetical protein